MIITNEYYGDVRAPHVEDSERLGGQTRNTHPQRGIWSSRSSSEKGLPFARHVTKARVYEGYIPWGQVCSDQYY